MGLISWTGCTHIRKWIYNSGHDFAEWVDCSTESKSTNLESIDLKADDYR